MSLVCLTLASVVASLPRVMNYQGKLTATGGVVVNDAVTMVFRIFSAESGGLPLWTEGRPAVPVVGGLFDVRLGTIVPLDLPFDTSYWLEVEGEELAPRIPLQTVPYAFRAIYSDTAAYAPAGWDTLESSSPEPWTVVNVAISGGSPGLMHKPYAGLWCSQPRRTLRSPTATHTRCRFGNRRDDERPNKGRAGVIAGRAGRR